MSDDQELARRNRELTILNEITAALNEEVDLSAALTTALNNVADLLQLRTGWIWLLAEDDQETAYLAAAQNLPPALRDNPRRMEGGCHCLNTFRAGDTGFAHATRNDRSMRSLAAAAGQDALGHVHAGD